MNCFEIDRVEPSLVSWSRTARPISLASVARRVVVPSPPVSVVRDAGSLDDALFGSVSTAIGIALLVAAVAL